jgi:Mn-dependent DtxR family transcriptional regulator
MDDGIAERRRRRTALLIRMYHEVDGSVARFISGFELAHTLGLERDEAEKAIAYLEEKGLLKVDDHRAGVLRLTAAGVDEAERRILESAE